MQNPDNALIFSKIHHRKKANPEAEDISEEIKPKNSYSNDDVMEFMTFLVDERYKLTNEINRAKHSTTFDIDANIETNKFRRLMASAIKNMLGQEPSETSETGHAYKFNAEGNQTPYVYEIEVVSRDAYDRNKAKSLFKKNCGTWTSILRFQIS